MQNPAYAGLVVPKRRARCQLTSIFYFAMLVKYCVAPTRARLSQCDMAPPFEPAQEQSSLLFPSSQNPAYAGLVVPRGGLEPPTYRSSGERSSQLSYLGNIIFLPKFSTYVTDIFLLKNSAILT